jgi:LPXTG-motif cell wall-anchored protein
MGLTSRFTHRTAVLLVAVLLATLLGAATASASSLTLMCHPERVGPGDEVSVVLTGADANSEVTFTARSGQRVLDSGTVMADGDGKASWIFVPERVTGIVNITATADVTYPVTDKHPYPPTKPDHTTCRVQVVAPPAVPSKPLPTTGLDTLAMFAVGLVLVGGGGAAVATAKRRERRRIGV